MTFLNRAGVQIDGDENTIAANILYNMSLDMDYADYEDYYFDNIDGFAEEIAGCSDDMRMLLQRIAVSNDDYYDLFRPKEA